MAVKKVGILGSTGSIGTQTLDVISSLNADKEALFNPHIEVVALAAGSNARLLAEQARRYNVKLLCIGDEEGADFLRRELSDMQPTVLTGSEGLVEIASAPMDILVTAIVGMRGLRPTLAAIERGTNIALANKETLVAAGDIVMKRAKECGVEIMPVDSEHSAVWQCLMSSGADGKSAAEKIVLTASGGPFRTYDAERLGKVTLEDALKHPTWNMGGKITIDCATMMNKGLEVIEAYHLFGSRLEDIDVLVHPQSIIHSMVMFRDGSVMAQLGMPDMRVPIRLALTYPYRGSSDTKRLDLAQIANLTFEKPDLERFPCLRLAYEALRIGGTMPAVMNGANEQAVEYFLKRHMNFTEIAYVIERVMQSHLRELSQSHASDASLDDILRCDAWAKAEVRGIVCK